MAFGIVAPHQHTAMTRREAADAVISERWYLLLQNARGQLLYLPPRHLQKLGNKVRGKIPLLQNLIQVAVSAVPNGIVTACSIASRAQSNGSLNVNGSANQIWPAARLEIAWIIAGWYL
jgi:hypothetical protein